MEENPYQPPMFDERPPSGASHTESSQIGQASGLSEAEIRAFVGKNAAYYLRKWTPALETNGRVRRFNAAAFWISGLWISYRKMYRVLFILLGIVAAETALEEAALAYGLADEGSIRLFDSLSTLGFSAVCGAFGNAWYLAHTKREIARIRALGLDDDAYHRALARRGGASYLAAVLLFSLFLAGLFMILVSIEYLLSQA